MYIKKGDICKCTKDMDELVDLEEASGRDSAEVSDQDMAEASDRDLVMDLVFHFNRCFIRCLLTPGYGYGYPYYHHITLIINLSEL